MDDSEQLWQSFRQRVVGHEVCFRRLAANSLLVYIDGNPGEEKGLTLWFEPTWHLCGSDRVLAGSRQAQHDPDASDPDAGFHQAADALSVLVNRRVTNLSIEPVTADLVLEIEGGFIVRTFVSDPTTDHLWHIRDRSTKTTLYRSGSGFEIKGPAA